MNAMDTMSQMTGMPSGKKPMRRGRHVGKSSVPKATTPQGHLDAAAAHLKAGNHAGAKSSALALANALHKMAAPKAPTAPASMPQQTPDAATGGF